MKLDGLQVGESATITSVDDSDSAMLRLAEMGLVPGETITVLREAPFGDPIEIRVMHTHLCLRRRDASAVLVEKQG